MSHEPAQPGLLRRLAPALSLFLLAPFVGEYLLGNVSVRMLFLLPMLALMYGAGALFIRELTRRTGRGWPTILALGLAYAVAEEGLADMSLFDPNFVGLHLLNAGRLFGIGWTWWIYVLTLHVVWSIGASIGLTEALFARRGTGPWLGKVGLVVSGLVFVLGVTLTQLSFHAKYQLVGWQVALSLGLIAVSTAVAFLLPRPRPTGAPGRAGSVPRPWLVTAGTVVAAGLFHVAEWLLPGGWPIPVDLALYAAVGAAVTLLARRTGWTLRHRYALVAGAVLTYCGVGFVLVPKHPVDIAGQVVFALIGAGLAVLAARKVHTATTPAYDERAAVPVR
ncbi:hypothetical protein [Actinocatenispora rupis]|uniref:Uncharacterized protein n=1 Tax=Actinocatenispora rupis TaxID=519421 RepID=A0A8J3NEI8_9ACTN|nr:hypothetical protein [Actinocatenispora rupis]GID14000.1 hypothetical protein Aru02nite_48890 [Actinocatenispora rupis]